MGVSYTAYTIIGIKVNANNFTTVESKRGCNCEIKDIEKMRFCSNCGANVSIDEEVCIPQFNENNDNSPSGESLCDYPIIYSDCEHSGEAYVAALCVDDDDYTKNDKNKMQIPKSIEAIKEKMKKKLEPIGFWDEKKFGIWSVLYCSY